MESSKRKILFSITIDDCEIQTFTVGGNGGSGKDTSNTGVRLIHHPSGAVGVGREERSQLANKRSAMRKLGMSKEFKIWAKLRASKMAGMKSAEELVEEAMEPKNIRVEVRGPDGKWTREQS